MSYKDIQQELHKLADPELAKFYLKFFKTNKGEYGEGDKFLGIKNGPLRQVAKKYKDIPLSQVQKLLESKYHEFRLIALAILTMQFQKAAKTPGVSKDLTPGVKTIYDFYLKNTKHINNWDLVDISAYKIVGAYLFKKDRAILYKLVKSDILWERRVAIISCFAFIREKDLKDVIKLAGILLKDKHDLIHKAVGWMLREVGKKDKKVLENFLDKHVTQMPRTILRYAIEKFDEPKRKYYLKK